MKKKIHSHANLITGIILIFILLLTSAPLKAQDKIEWMSFEEAVKKSQKKPKHIFVDVYTDWCGWCKRMDATTFTDPVIVELMNKYFYAVKLDAERKDTVIFEGHPFVNTDPAGRRSSHQLAQALLKGKMSYPSFVFLNSKHEWLTVVNGYRKVPEMEQVLTYFGEYPYEKMTWEAFIAEFQSKIPADTTSH